MPARVRHNWPALRVRYVTSNPPISLAELSRETGVAERIIKTRSAKEDWPAERDRFQEEVATAVERKARERQAQEIVDVAGRVRIIGRAALSNFAERLRGADGRPPVNITEQGFVNISRLLLLIDHQLPSPGMDTVGPEQLSEVDRWVASLTGGEEET